MSSAVLESLFAIVETPFLLRREPQGFFDEAPAPKRSEPLSRYGARGLEMGEQERSEPHAPREVLD
ncbi:hypothetical protein CKO23_16890 [Thiocystis violacea]|nr:hypothetical protein [Thiocystis violacea]